MRYIILLMALIGVGGQTITAQVVMETVTVGNPGNAGNSSGFLPCVDDTGAEHRCGAVDYIYTIGIYEVTAGQYVEFLNAVAATDTYGLYSTLMNSFKRGCQITQNGSSGNYTYDFSGRHSGTEDDWINRPVNYVSWADTARFANWMHNGQPTGLQDLTTTEDGSYFLNGAVIDEELQLVMRKTEATWVIPSEDERYKAAYHHNDGVTDNYWAFPTQSDARPTAEIPPGTDLTNGSANFGGRSVVGGPFWRTVVGAYDAKPSDSPYGTFDQGGNLWEWTEGVISHIRTLRGGSFEANGLRAASREAARPTVEDDVGGFRVANISPTCDKTDADGDGRVTICHIPPGNSKKARTITIGINAVPAHLAHGDHCGPCEE